MSVTCNTLKLLLSFLLLSRLILNFCGGIAPRCSRYCHETSGPKEHVELPSVNPSTFGNGTTVAQEVEQVVGLNVAQKVCRRVFECKTRHPHYFV